MWVIVLAKCKIYVYELVVCQFSFEGNGGTMLGGTVLAQKSSYLIQACDRALHPSVLSCLNPARCAYSCRIKFAICAFSNGRGTRPLVAPSGRTAW
ncbi:MAG: hypothetical protein F6K10_29895 [Moorea sp. SIO2B7]|nr:hypothetical protein [Moorena sp. SIO3E2]NES85287.1 hypothetical protein [Moorena sp. SIO2B7]